MKSSIALVASGILLCISALARGEAVVFTKEELKAYFALEMKLHPERGDQFRQLTKTFGDRENYTPDQVTAITDPKISKPYRYDQHRPTGRKSTGRPPADSFASADVRRHFDIIERRDPSVGDLWLALVDKYGEQPWYLASEIRDVEECCKA